MAFLKFENLRIAGISAGVPKNVRRTENTNGNYDDEKYIETTGVAEKRIDKNLTTSDLCLAAAERLIDDLGWERKDIDVLLFVSQTPDYILPATACVLHGKLGLKRNCYAMDISLGCSGWVYGLSAALSLVNAGGKKALLMAGDARGNCTGFVKTAPDPLFGYAGTVTAIEFAPGNSSPIVFDFGTDGTGYDAIITPGGGCRNPINEETFKLKMCEDGKMRHDLIARMKGMDVFAFGITAAPKSVKNLAKEFGFDYLDYDYFIFHQANMKMNDTICTKLKLPAEKVPSCMRNFGNTSSASIPLTIVTQLRGKVEDKPTKFICCGFGVGLSWGTVAFSTEKLVISELVEI